jgi:hypothetical protein
MKSALALPCSRRPTLAAFSQLRGLASKADFDGEVSKVYAKMSAQFGHPHGVRLHITVNMFALHNHPNVE